VSLFFCPIRDRDCVARCPSTSRLNFDVGVDFTGLFFLSDPAAWQDGGTLGGALCAAAYIAASSAR
jgi:hypothetical protein